MNQKILSQKGISTVEFLCACGFAVIAVVAIVWGLIWYRNTLRIGDDNRMVNTAERVATINSMDGQHCVVNDCSRWPGCVHHEGNNSMGYFDNVGNKIVGELPRGYNEYPTMTIGGQTWRGEPNSMVIQVVHEGDHYILRWVKGRE